MSEEELIQHCEKQIMLCEALGDNKHCLEHQLTLNIIQQRDLYKSVIDKIENKCEEIIENNKYSYLSSTNDILTAIGETDTARAIKKILFEYKANIKEDKLGGE